MGADARGIGRSRLYPCVGDPVDWRDGEWFTCGAEGAFSLLTLVPEAAVADTESWAPVLVHVTACREHVRAARAWLRDRTEDEIDTYATEFVMANWSQIQETMEDTPVLRLMEATA